MNVFKKLGFLPAIALGCVLGASAIHPAEAAQRPVISEQQAAEPVATQAAPVYYTWHKHRYAYKYRGRYFNHRSRKNNQWYYY